MANFDQLKQSVAALIRTNGAEEITGQIMQDVLLTIINSISGGYMFGGVAQHNGNVGNPDYNVFYLAGSGAYTGYGGAITIEAGCYGVFRYNGVWTQEVVDIGVRLSGSIAEGETRGVTGDVINTALQTLFNNVMDILDTLTFTYNTPSAQQATKAMIDVIMTPTGGASHVFATLTLASATVAAAGLMSAADKAVLDCLVVMLGYYVCDTAAGTAAKTVAATGYSLTNGGCIRIKMTNANTANNVTLNINSTGAKALYYDGAQASSTNTWEAGEVLEVYYDGTQYQCASGGGGKFATGEKVKNVSLLDNLDNSGNLPKSSAVQNYVNEKTVGYEYPLTLNTKITGVQIENGKWVSQSQRGLYIIPYTYHSGDKLKLTGNSTNGSYYAFLTSNDHTVGNDVAFAIQGQTGWSNVGAGVTSQIAIPSNCTYIAINSNYSTSDFMPSIMSVVVSSELQIGIAQQFDEVNAEIDGIEQQMVEEVQVDMSQYIENAVWIQDSGRTWATSSSVHCKIIPCLPNTKYKMVVTQKTVRFCFLRSLTYTVGQAADTCEGYSTDRSITSTSTVVSPSDAVGLYFLIRVNQSDFILPSQLTYEASKLKNFDAVPTKGSQNGITSGGTWNAFDEIRYYGLTNYNLLSEITTSMWEKTTWNGSSYATSGSGATILLPAEMFSDGEMQIKYSTSDIAVHLIKVAEGITSLANGTSAVITKQSGYISAVNGYKMVCNGDFNRIAIQIRATTGTAAGDIARLQNLIVPVAASETPINKKVLGDAYNASLDTLRFRFPTYNAVRYPYTGERIFDKTFSLTQIGNGVGNQGSCCYNGVVFGFSSNSTTVKIYDMVNDIHTSCSIANMSPSNPHNNSAFFTDEFYDANDPFPIIGTSDDINNNVLLFRIAVNNGTYSMTLVQTIHIEKGETAFSQGNTFTYGNGKLFSLAENNPRTHWYVYEWPMPTLSQGDVTLTSSSENEHMIAEVNNYQGMCYKDGYMFMPEKTSNSNIIVVNMATDEVITHIPVSSVISTEIEDTWFYYDKLYFTTYGGLIYKIDLY